MQYKIPVQIENEDPIVFGLSIRQLLIIVVGSGIAYGIFKRLEQSLGTEVALIPPIFILIITFVVALFKKSEMTFVPFFLSFLRYKLNTPKRRWEAGVDSFSPMDIGFLTSKKEQKKEDLDLSNKYEKLKSFDEKIKKL